VRRTWPAIATKNPSAEDSCSRILAEHDQIADDLQNGHSVTLKRIQHRKQLTNSDDARSVEIIQCQHIAFKVVVHRNCAGIDIGSREHWVAVDRTLRRIVREEPEKAQ
jgi:hypothetical protein